MLLRWDCLIGLVFEANKSFHRDCLEDVKFVGRDARVALKKLVTMHMARYLLGFFSLRDGKFNYTLTAFA